MKKILLLIVLALLLSSKTYAQSSGWIEYWEPCDKNGNSMPNGNWFDADGFCRFDWGYNNIHAVNTYPGILYQGAQTYIPNTTSNQYPNLYLIRCYEPNEIDANTCYGLAPLPGRSSYGEPSSNAVAKNYIDTNSGVRQYYYNGSPIKGSVASAGDTQLRLYFKWAPIPYGVNPGERPSPPDHISVRLKSQVSAGCTLPVFNIPSVIAAKASADCKWSGQSVSSDVSVDLPFSQDMYNLHYLSTNTVRAIVTAAVNKEMAEAYLDYSTTALATNLPDSYINGEQVVSASGSPMAWGQKDNRKVWIKTGFEPSYYYFDGGFGVRYNNEWMRKPDMSMEVDSVVDEVDNSIIGTVGFEALKEGYDSNVSLIDSYWAITGSGTEQSVIIGDTIIVHPSIYDNICTSYRAFYPNISDKPLTVEDMRKPLYTQAIYRGKDPTDGFISTNSYKVEQISKLHN